MIRGMSQRKISLHWSNIGEIAQVFHKLDLLHYKRMYLLLSPSQPLNMFPLYILRKDPDIQIALLDKFIVKILHEFLILCDLMLQLLTKRHFVSEVKTLQMGFFETHT